MQNANQKNNDPLESRIPRKGSVRFGGGHIETSSDDGERRGVPTQLTLIPGMKGEATTTVIHENTAAAVGAGGVEVFGTPLMIALMENAAWESVADALDEGYVTVGTLVNVRHLAATPLGQKVRATAELVEVDGRRLVFQVEAYDEQQKIGEGLHERFIVNLQRFMSKIAG